MLKNQVFETEFKNFNSTIPKRTLQLFIDKATKQKFNLYWRYDNNEIFLMIDSYDTIIELPFKKEKDKIILNLENLKVSREEISNLLEELIRLTNGNAIIETKKEKQYTIKRYKNGHIINEHSCNEELFFINTRELSRQQIINIINLEIDYNLMELFDALKKKDTQTINSCKRKLKILTEKKVVYLK